MFKILVNLYIFFKNLVNLCFKNSSKFKLLNLNHTNLLKNHYNFTKTYVIIYMLKTLNSN